MDKCEIDYERLPRQNILCIDMKSFYASVEAVDRGMDPLKVCLAVIGDKSRPGSVVLAASPVLKKKYRIKTGNRLYEIPKISDLMIVEARMGLYLNRSLQITRLYNEFVPLDAIHVYSIDEAWLKLDGTERLSGCKWQVARSIKKELLNRFGLPCSIGIGPNMFLAKAAMDIEGKKLGLVEWTYEDIPSKLWPVNLKECWGIGDRLARRFNKIGVRTVGDLARLPLKYLERNFGIIGNQLYYHAWGVDLSKLKGHYDDKPKSLGRGITLLRDYKELEEIKTVIFELADEVGRRARSEHLAGKTVQLGIGYSYDEGRGFQARQTINNYTNLTSDIYQTALELLKKNYNGQVVRKINLALTELAEDSALRLNLFTDKLKEARLSTIRDYIQERFGYRSIYYGISLKNEKASIKERISTTIGGHKSGDDFLHFTGP
jgi:DNA polymerase V